MGENSTAEKHLSLWIFTYFEARLSSAEICWPWSLSQSWGWWKSTKLWGWKGWFPRLRICVPPPLGSAQNPGWRVTPSSWCACVFPAHWNSESKCFQGLWCTYNILNHFCDVCTIIWDSEIFSPALCHSFPRIDPWMRFVLFKLKFFLRNMYILFIWHVLFSYRHADWKGLPQITPYNFSFPKRCFQTLGAQPTRQIAPANGLHHPSTRVPLHSSPQNCILLLLSVLKENLEPCIWRIPMTWKNKRGLMIKMISFLLYQLSLCLVCKSLLST